MCANAVKKVVLRSTMDGSELTMGKIVNTNYICETPIVDVGLRVVKSHCANDREKILFFVTCAEGRVELFLIPSILYILILFIDYTYTKTFNSKHS